jgi:hypothetical protein
MCITYDSPDPIEIPVPSCFAAPAACTGNLTCACLLGAGVCEGGASCDLTDGGAIVCF